MKNSESFMNTQPFRVQVRKSITKSIEAIHTNQSATTMDPSSVSYPAVQRIEEVPPWRFQSERSRNKMGHPASKAPERTIAEQAPLPKAGHRLQHRLPQVPPIPNFAAATAETTGTTGWAANIESTSAQSSSHRLYAIDRQHDQRRCVSARRRVHRS